MAAPSSHPIVTRVRQNLNLLRALKVDWVRELKGLLSSMGAGGKNRLGDGA